jgi:hypothetical protein
MKCHVEIAPSRSFTNLLEDPAAVPGDLAANITTISGDRSLFAQVGRLFAQSGSALAMRLSSRSGSPNPPVRR